MSPEERAIQYAKLGLGFLALAILTYVAIHLR